ncbi:MAG: ATP-binding protein [Arcobacter sp.]|jgi:signal transduction histidine kinase|uniref:ATP-binding protein n=1 Tax=unclassified Arcobacter TaxID=2593671 RepID=UPI000229613A|nr:MULTISPECIES: ATP-binding protein [unclassified Arcobacter]MDY3199750.1 ATP-binding protein [Arcobacter sp.]BAK73525.1 two-component sensor kinase [Arcobacter sp. L]
MIDKIKAFYSHSIKRRLIITVTLTHVFLMSIFVYDLISEQKEFLKNQSNEQVTSLTKMIVRNSVSWILSNDYVGLEELISSISKYPNLEYAMIINKNGKILAHTQEEKINLYLSDKLSTDFFDSKKIESKMLIQNNKILDYISPVFRENQHIGWVRVALNQNINSQNIEEIFKEGLFFINIAIIVGYIFAYFLAKNITKDLYTLMKIAKQTATGTRNQRADISRKDELGVLAKDINNMLDKIEKDEKQLEISNRELEKDIVKLELMDSKLTLLNKNLEKKVVEKTYELKKLNDNLKKEIEEEVEQNRQKDNMLFQQSKMASMGEMIENIAHQWRQPLSFISTSASGIKLNKEYHTLTDEILDEAIENIMNSTQFLSNTIDDFRDFYKIDKIKDKFNVKEIIHKTLKLTTSRFTSRSIQVIEDCDDVFVFGFENELVQVFINILNNARDELEKLPYEERFIFITIKKEKNEAYISLKDNANGIEPTILEKIFDPYFTTKGSDKGTGIGLFMSKEIIEKHFNGKIIAVNENFIYNKKEYNGANFIITIPL